MSVQGGQALPAGVPCVLPSVTSSCGVLDQLLQVEPTGLPRGPACPAVPLMALGTSCIYFYFALFVSSTVYLFHVTMRQRRAGSLPVMILLCP